MSGFAQKSKIAPDAGKIALQYLQSQRTAWHLTDQDVHQAAVQYQYKTAHNGVSHVYLIQQNFGVELYNGIVNINVLPSGEVLSAGNRFMPDLMGSANTTTPVLTAEEAIRRAAAQIHLDIPHGLVMKGQISDKEFVFEPSGISFDSMRVKLRYQKMGEKVARLAWDLDINAVNGTDWWSFRVDAVTGVILNRTSWTTHEVRSTRYEVLSPKS